MKYEELLDWFAQRVRRSSGSTRSRTSPSVASLLASEAGAGITGSLISIDGGTAPY